VCCSVLQCVAVCCSVLQRVAGCCSVLQCVAVCCSVLQCVAVCCCVLQCVTMYDSVLQSGAVLHVALVSKETFLCQKRLCFVKRDMYTWKETYTWNYCTFWWHPTVVKTDFSLSKKEKRDFLVSNETSVPLDCTRESSNQTFSVSEEIF